VCVFFEPVTSISGMVGRGLIVHNFDFRLHGSGVLGQLKKIKMAIDTSRILWLRFSGRLWLLLAYMNLPR